MHPRVIQVPPTGPLSNSATRLPRRRAARTAAQPPMPEPITATSNRPSDPEDPRRPEIGPRILRDRLSNVASVGRGVDPQPTPASGGRRAAQRLMPRYAAAIQLTVIAAGRGESTAAPVRSKPMTPEEKSGD